MAATPGVPLAQRVISSASWWTCEPEAGVGAAGKANRLLVADLGRREVVQTRGHPARRLDQLDRELGPECLVDPVVDRAGAGVAGRRVVHLDHFETVTVVQVAPDHGAHAVESRAGKHHQAGTRSRDVVHPDPHPFAELGGILGRERPGGEEEDQQDVQTFHGEAGLK